MNITDCSMCTTLVHVIRLTAWFNMSVCCAVLDSDENLWHLPGWGHLLGWIVYHHSNIVCTNLTIMYTHKSYLFSWAWYEVIIESHFHIATTCWTSKNPVPGNLHISKNWKHIVVSFNNWMKLLINWSTYFSYNLNVSIIFFFFFSFADPSQRLSEWSWHI